MHGSFPLVVQDRYLVHTGLQRPARAVSQFLAEGFPGDVEADRPVCQGSVLAEHVAEARSDQRARGMGQGVQVSKDPYRGGCHDGLLIFLDGQGAAGGCKAVHRSGSRQGNKGHACPVAAKAHDIGQGSRTHPEIAPPALIRLQQHLDEVGLIRGRIARQHNGAQAVVNCTDGCLNLPSQGFVFVFICHQRECSVLLLSNEFFELADGIFANVHFGKLYGHGYLR